MGSHSYYFCTKGVRNGIHSYHFCKIGVGNVITFVFILKSRCEECDHIRITFVK